MKDSDLEALAARLLTWEERLQASVEYLRSIRTAVWWLAWSAIITAVLVVFGALEGCAAAQEEADAEFAREVLRQMRQRGLLD